MCDSRISPQFLRFLPFSLFASTECLKYLFFVLRLIGESSVYSCSRHHHSCLTVSSGSGENIRNISCNVGSTQSIRRFLPPPSHKSTQLFGSDIFNAFHYSPCNGSEPFPGICNGSGPSHQVQVQVKSERLPNRPPGGQNSTSGNWCTVRW